MEYIVWYITYAAMVNKQNPLTGSYSFWHSIVDAAIIRIYHWNGSLAACMLKSRWHKIAIYWSSHRQCGESRGARTHTHPILASSRSHSFDSAFRNHNPKIEWTNTIGPREPFIGMIVISFDWFVADGLIHVHNTNDSGYRTHFVMFMGNVIIKIDRKRHRSRLAEQIKITKNLST